MCIVEVYEFSMSYCCLQITPRLLQVFMNMKKSSVKNIDDVLDHILCVKLPIPINSTHWRCLVKFRSVQNVF